MLAPPEMSVPSGTSILRIVSGKQVCYTGRGRKPLATAGGYAEARRVLIPPKASSLA